MTQHLQEVSRRPLLVIDSHPWYSEPEQYDRTVRSVFEDLGFQVMGAEELAERAARLADAVLRPGDLVVLPLMSGALFSGPLKERADRLGVPVVCLPLSRHPFVTLSADPAETLLHSCTEYARSSARLVGELPGLLRRSRERVARIVFFDSNSATGKDFVLFGERVRPHLRDNVDLHFSVLISETAEDEAHGPGHRGGRKLHRPDSAALRLIGSNTRFLSHLRFLRHGIAEQVRITDRLRGALPDLTAYWETVPAELRSIHNYGESTQLIHKKRLHIRFAAADEERAHTLTAGVRRLDGEYPLGTGPEVLARRRALMSSWPDTLRNFSLREAA
ncbi:hypothetical protein ACFY1U_47920 [Streptomyces sp. NPDC001351]|uniref:hypothetical protein n=1 Tax=Streptomyces sp. NPDC001351 TaxID=3364564 RepID=UPI00369F752E